MARRLCNYADVRSLVIWVGSWGVIGFLDSRLRGNDGRLHAGVTVVARGNGGRLRGDASGQSVEAACILRVCSSCSSASTNSSISPSRIFGRLWLVRLMRWSVTRDCGKL